MANKKRLIDANALKRKLGQVALYVQGFRFGKTVISKILESYRRAVFEEIDNAPTVDAVEVVRCKDCKWYAPNNEGSWIGCAFDTRHPDDVPKADDFCSYGERKDNG